MSIIQFFTSLLHASDSRPDAEHPRAAEPSYWPARAYRVPWGTWARWPSRCQRRPARAACFPRPPGDWTVKEQGEKESQHSALPPPASPTDTFLFRSLSASRRPVCCAWFQASSTGCLNSINQLSSLISASRQGRQIVFSANLSYSQLQKLTRFSLVLWFLSSSSWFPLHTCQVQHIHQGRIFQKAQVKVHPDKSLVSDPLCAHSSRAPLAYLSLKKIQCCVIHRHLNDQHLLITFAFLPWKCFRWFTDTQCSLHLYWLFNLRTKSK